MCAFFLFSTGCIKIKLLGLGYMCSTGCIKKNLCSTGCLKKALCLGYLSITRCLGLRFICSTGCLKINALGLGYACSTVCLKMKALDPGYIYITRCLKIASRSRIHSTVRLKSSIRSDTHFSFSNFLPFHSRFVLYFSSLFVFLYFLSCHCWGVGNIAVILTFSISHFHS